MDKAIIRWWGFDHVEESDSYIKQAIKVYELSKVLMIIERNANEMVEYYEAKLGGSLQVKYMATQSQERRIVKEIEKLNVVMMGA